MEAEDLRQQLAKAWNMILRGRFANLQCFPLSSFLLRRPLLPAPTSLTSTTQLTQIHLHARTHINTHPHRLTPTYYSGTNLLIPTSWRQLTQTHPSHQLTHTNILDTGSAVAANKGSASADVAAADVAD